MKRVSIYCSSSAQIDPAYFQATSELTELLIAREVEIVCGGGARGLMGQLANTCIEKGGSITGVMPHFMKKVEWNHPGIENMIYTETMHERKMKFLENVDALITLAGGIGTLEEFFEAVTLKRLGKFLKPIIVLNTNGYYDPLIAMLKNGLEGKFMSGSNVDIWTFVNTPAEVIPAIENAKVWTAEAIHGALLK